MSDVPLLSELIPPSGQTELLYQVSNTQTATGTIFCLNQADVNDSVSIALVPNTHVISSNSYIANGSIVYGGQSIYLQQIYLNSGDMIYVESQNGTSNFIFNGTGNPTNM